MNPKPTEPSNPTPNRARAQSWPDRIFYFLLLFAGSAFFVGFPGNWEQAPTAAKAQYLFVPLASAIVTAVLVDLFPAIRPDRLVSGLAFTTTFVCVAFVWTTLACTAPSALMVAPFASTPGAVWRDPHRLLQLWMYQSIVVGITSARPWRR